MTNQLYLIRGLPGSGKSTYAKFLSASIPSSIVLEADDFFISPDGIYRYLPKQVFAAHMSTKAKMIYEYSHGSTVIVANTFTTLWEINDYKICFTKAGFSPDALRVIKMTTQFNSIHHVPSLTLSRMKDRWEDFPGENLA